MPRGRPKRPRLCFTASFETARRIEELSRLTGESSSSILSQLVDMAGPSLDRVIVLLQELDKAKAECQQVMVSKVAGLMQELANALLSAEQTLDSIVSAGCGCVQEEGAPEAGGEERLRDRTAAPQPAGSGGPTIT